MTAMTMLRVTLSSLLLSGLSLAPSPHVLAEDQVELGTPLLTAGDLPPTPPPSGRRLLATVTAYCDTGVMRDGSYTRPGVVAVDPSVIPLGSRLTIDGLPGIYLAADTGGGVIGSWVDVWHESCLAAREWGRQTRAVEVLPW